MPISAIQTLELALMPGASESLESLARRGNNDIWLAMARNVTYSRNGLYISVALIAIAAIGAALNAPTEIMLTVAILGVGLTLIAAKTLYDATMYVQWAINQGWSP